MNPVKHHIVVWDPKGEFWEGSVVEASYAPSLRARGCALLPCSPDLFRRGAGYAKRSWGAGFPLDRASPKMHAPLSLLIFRDHNTVHWTARLLSDGKFDEAAKDKSFRPGGSLRFVGDGREATHHMMLSPETPPIDVRELGEKDAFGGWTVSGRARMNPQLDGHFGFALYGMGEGLRVAWVAMTSTTEKL